MSKSYDTTPVILSLFLFFLGIAGLVMAEGSIATDDPKLGLLIKFGAFSAWILAVLFVSGLRPVCHVKRKMKVRARKNRTSPNSGKAE